MDLHGFTVEDIHNLARQAVFTDRFRIPIHLADRIDAAVCAITVLLCTSDQEPHRNELLYAGQNASVRFVDAEMRHHGIDTDHRDREPGSHRAAFERYWMTLPGDRLEDRIVDRASLYQIWARLHPGQRAALLALAQMGDYATAADSLGLTYKAFCSQVLKARRRFLEFWHEGEEPSRVWGHDRRRGRPTTGRTAMRNVRRRAALASAVEADERSGRDG